MAKKLPFIKKRLFSPGPTPLPLQSRLLLVDELPYHRTRHFYSVFLKCREMLATLMGTAHPPVILTASGTGAMEAALVNCTNPGDRVLCLVSGKFGERWRELASAYSCQVDTLDIPWGQGLDLDALERRLKQHNDYKAIMLQGVETSTAIAFSVKSIAALVRRSSPSALIIVDAISSLGAHALAMDEWGVDIVVGGSQKGLSSPPGLSFVACSPRARAQWSSRPRFYFDLAQEFSLQESGQSQFTPASSTIMALHTALEIIHDYGCENFVAYHHCIAEGVRAALECMGLKLVGSGPYAHSVSAAYLPEGINGKALVDELQQRYGMTFAGGQGTLQGRIIRFAHLGLFDYFDICAGLVALEHALHSHGYLKKLGSGVAAFMQVTAALHAHS